MHQEGTQAETEAKFMPEKTNDPTDRSLRTRRPNIHPPYYATSEPIPRALGHHDMAALIGLDSLRQGRTHDRQTLL